MGDLLFIDTETTGLEPALHVVIDIWAELRRGPGLDLVADGGGRVTVSAADLDAASPEALRVNGYTEEAWREARPWADAWRDVERVAAQARGPVVAIVGSNPGFDREMILGMHWRHGTAPLRLRGLFVDTADLAEPLVRARRIPNRKLATLADHFRLPAQDHTARGDVATCVEVYRRLTATEVAA